MTALAEVGIPVGRREGVTVKVSPEIARKIRIIATLKGTEIQTWVDSILEPIVESAFREEMEKELKRDKDKDKSMKRSKGE